MQRMNDRLLRALRRQPVDRTPVWFMRQAGRSLPAYRAMRRERGFLDLVRDPEAAAAITALPLDSYDVDAAILFMDLSTPFEAAGLALRIEPGIGPVVEEGALEPGRLRSFDPREALGAPLEALRLLKRRIEVPLIGFVGAPFTLVSYLLPGSRERRLGALRRLLSSEPAVWDRAADFWVDHQREFAIAQYEAGADVVQVFDTWAGVLTPDEYEARVLPYSSRLLDGLRRAGVPTIHFAMGDPRLLSLLARAGGDALSVDWRTPIDEAWRAIGHDRAIQGNLDPTALLAGAEAAAEGARRVLERAGGRRGHIFNLGHGILPETDPAAVRAVVRAVAESACG